MAPKLRRHSLRRADGRLGRFAAVSFRVVAKAREGRRLRSLATLGRTPVMCGCTSVRRSINGVGTRLRATLVRRMRMRPSRGSSKHSSGRSVSLEAGAPRPQESSTSVGGARDQFDRTLRRSVELTRGSVLRNRWSSATRTTVCLQIGCVASSEVTRTRPGGSASVGRTGMSLVGSAQSDLGRGGQGTRLFGARRNDGCTEDTSVSGVALGVSGTSRRQRPR